MRSQWIEYKGKPIFYQNFAGLFYNSEAVKKELNEVQQIVTAQPENSVLVLADFRDTQITSDLLGILNEASARTKKYVHKTAVLGVTGIKRTLADLLVRLTGQPLMYFDTEEEAKEWLVKGE